MISTVVDTAVEQLLQPVLAAATDHAHREGVTLAIGCGSPGIPLAPDGGRVLVLPALGPDAPPPWAFHRMARAGAVGLLDRSEALVIRRTQPTTPGVLIGLPRPERQQRTEGVDMGDVPGRLEMAWAEVQGDLPDDGPGVTWIRGVGVVPVARAVLAWAQGRAVVALPGTMYHPLLRAGGVLQAEGPLDAIEATMFVRRAPALVAALAARGRAASAALPERRQVSLRMEEAIILTASGGAP